MSALPPGATPFTVDGDSTGTYVTTFLREGPNSSRVAIYRAHDGVADEQPLPANTDFHDFTQADHFAPTLFQAVRVKNGRAYVSGSYGVTVAPFDGSPSRLFVRPSSDPRYDLDYAGYVMAFRVEDDGSILTVYTVYGSGVTCMVGRYSADGAWTELAHVDEACAEDSVVTADEEAIYFATSHVTGADGSIWRLERSTNATTRIADHLSYGGPVDMAEDDQRLYLADFGEVDAVDKHGGPLKRLVTLPGSDPGISRIGVFGGELYELTQVELRRRPADGGDAEVLAQRAVPGGFEGLTLGPEGAFFADADIDANDDVSAVVRRVSVP